MRKDRAECSTTGGVAGARDTSDVLAAIEEGRLDPVYCFTGDERFFVDQCLAALRRAVLGATGANAFNLDVFELKDKGLGAALDSARTLPMFAKRRLIIARGIDDLKSDESDPLVDYVKDPNPSTCLVLVAGGKIDGRLRVFSALRKAGFLHDFPRLKDWQLADWVIGEARRRKLAIESEAARALAEAAGSDVGRLALCLEQVSLFAGKDAKIRTEHVEAVVPETRERGIFELTKAIGAGIARRR